jgi:nucleoside-diphosphate-sugar epimerase
MTGIIARQRELVSWGEIGAAVTVPMREDRAMRILVLGGSWFLGRALVEEALHRGHEVTTFNRGRTGHDVPGAEIVRGDRSVASDLEELAGKGPWDAVIDTSGMVPAVVLNSARVLCDQAGRYAYVSTVNVYQEWPTEPLWERSPVRQCASDALDEGEDSGADRYGRLKAGCEQAVFQIFEDRALVLRPGVILGPQEYVGRLPWWLERMRRGGTVLCPGDPGEMIQPVDVRDVAAFALDGVEAELRGAFNVAAPLGHATVGELLTACAEATNSMAESVWVPDEFLAGQGAGIWTELPLWQTYAGTWQVHAERAQAVGLSCRPLRETVLDTWAWLSSGEGAVQNERRTAIGMDPQKEARILAAWAAHVGR